MFNVFLDTEVFSHEMNDVRSRKLTSLKKYCEIGLVRLFTADVVVREVKSHLEKGLQEQYDKLKNILKSKPISLLQTDKGQQAVEVPPLELLNGSLLGQLDEYIKETDCTVIASAGVTVPELLNDYFNEVPPFEERKEKKHEFPDAIIIKALKAFWAERTDKVYVITNDGGWKAALAEDERFEVIDELEQMLTTVSQYNKKLYADKYIRYLSDNANEIIAQVKNHMEEIEWYEKINSDVIETEDVYTSDVENIRLKLDDFEYIDAESAIVRINADVVMKLEYTYLDYESSFSDDETGVLYNVGSGEKAEEHRIEVELTVEIVEKDGELKDINVEYEDFDLDDALTLISRTNHPYEEGPDYEDYFAEQNFEKDANLPF